MRKDGSVAVGHESAVCGTRASLLHLFAVGNMSYFDWADGRA